MNKMRVFIWLIALIGFSACQSKSGQTTEQENVDSLTVAPTEEEKTITGVVGDASMHIRGKKRCVSKFGRSENI